MEKDPKLLIQEALDYDQIEQLRFAIKFRIEDVKKRMKADERSFLDTKPHAHALALLNGTDTKPGLLQLVTQVDSTESAQKDVFYDDDDPTRSPEDCPHENTRRRENALGQEVTYCRDCGIEILEVAAGKDVEEADYEVVPSIGAYVRALDGDEATVLQVADVTNGKATLAKPADFEEKDGQRSYTAFAFVDAQVLWWNETEQAFEVERGVLELAPEAPDPEFGQSVLVLKEGLPEMKIAGIMSMPPHTVRLVPHDSDGKDADTFGHVLPAAMKWSPGQEAWAVSPDDVTLAEADG